MPEKPFQPPSGFASKQREAAEQDPRTRMDADHPYTVSELVDLAERHNPSTRAAWENTRAAAARLGIARSDLLPAMNAVALTNTTREGILFNDVFVQQTLGIFQPMLQLNYLIFDFGGRSARIDEARQQLLGANLTFNRTFLDVLFETMRRYYEFLNSMGQREAAQANFDNAETVRKAVEARLTVGLATLPDALEARSAAAQANFTLQAAIGDVDIRRGDLLSLVGAAPSERLQVQPLAEIPTPDHLDTDVHEATERSLSLRPEIGEQTAEREAARAEIRAARSAYFPTLQFQGQVGVFRSYGRQDLFPGVYTGPQGEWNVNATLEWDLFDGGRRSNQLAEARAVEKKSTGADRSDPRRCGAAGLDRVHSPAHRVLPARRRSGTPDCLADLLQCRSQSLSTRSAQYRRRGLSTTHSGAGAQQRCLRTNNASDRARRLGLSHRRSAADRHPESPIHDNPGKDSQEKTSAEEYSSRHTVSAGLAATLVFALTGCARSPSFNVLGSYFPGWIACMVASILADCSRSVRTKSIAMGAASAGSPFVLFRHGTAHRLLNLADRVRVKRKEVCVTDDNRKEQTKHRLRRRAARPTLRPASAGFVPKQTERRAATEKQPTARARRESARRVTP